MSDNQERFLLVVEDDDVLRERLSKAMERRGFKTFGAKGFQDALQIVSTARPNFAILDVKLPDGSGLDLVEEIMLRNPDARPIIYTGYGNIPAAVSATRLGAFDFISKPATSDEIADVLLTPAGESTPPPGNPILPDQARREHIERVLRDEGENISQAARSLNMHRRTLQRVLQRKWVSNDALQ